MVVCGWTAAKAFVNELKRIASNGLGMAHFAEATAEHARE